jgi:asparagine synthase (glutamine-hydrolysing)
MCGILGTVDAFPPSEQVFGRMLDSLTHRGPDGRGTISLNNGSVLLGHRRLAIIDIGPDGAQPICNEDGAIWLTFNGEIYNYVSLRRQLIDLGHCFRSKSDSEVIIHAYEEWGRDCVKRLRGIFAFGIWDGRKQDLFLARDPLGVKPLYYARYGSRFTFASQPKAIVTDPAFDRAIDPYGIRDFLAYGYIPYDRSAFAGILKLPAGHTVTISNGALELRRYWQLDCQPILGDPREAILRLRAGLANAVQSQLVADVPIGCFLSGGIDSSLLVALAKPSLPNLRSFTVGFEEAERDERQYARLVSEHFGTEHLESVLVQHDLKQRLYDMQEYFDEPFDPTAPIPYLEVAKLARQNNISVALGGDGADELFAGYLRYDDFDRPGWMSSGYSRNVWHRLRHCNLLGPRSSAAGDLSRYFRYEGCLDADGLRAVLGESVLDQLQNGHQSAMERFYRPELPAVTAARYLDVNLFMVDQVLCKVDRASMAHGVEVRVPFLDPELVTLAFQIPLTLHYRSSERKALLKRIAAQYLPQQVITPRKKGFSSPLEKWFDAGLEPWMRSWTEDGILVQHGLLQPDWSQRLASVQGAQGAVGKRAHWLILTAELWARRWIAGRSLSSAELAT